MTKMKIELAINDWFAIHAMLVVTQEDISKNMGRNPLVYSRTSRALNNFATEFMSKITTDQIDEYVAWKQKEMDDVS